MIIKLSNTEARKYFLKSEVYFNLDLPEYFDFAKMLEAINNYCDKNEIILDEKYDFEEHLKKIKQDKITGNNKYTILIHKNQYNYRPISLIDPVLYVFLVRIITQKDNWKKIQERFEKFEENSKISCHSLPPVGPEKVLNKIIDPWIKYVEQQSLINSLEYNCLFKTDIANCYPSIYTHSISWAIHDKETAKKKTKDKTLLGNQIDEIIKYISDNQTNGIPQGSVLMDFIAEIVLFYLDTKISAKIEEQKLDCKIIRWRDDYRVFAQNENTLNSISKIFAEEFFEFNFHMNSEKTKIYSDIIVGSIKPEKIAITTKNLIFPIKYSYHNILKFLIKLHVFATENKEASSIAKFFNHEHREKFNKIKIIEDKQIQVLIAILVKILSKNLIYFRYILAVIIRLLSKIQNAETERDIIIKIKNKFDSLLYIEYLEIWLQRVIIKVKDIEYKEYKSRLTKLLISEDNWWEVMFKNDWLKEEVKKIFKDVSIIDKGTFNKREPRIKDEELSDFEYGDSSGS